MRMWMIPAGKMCRKHLLGEHVEIHMLAGSIIKRNNINGFLENALVFPSKIKSRHNELAGEMKRRGFNHKSKLPHYTLIKKYLTEKSPDLKANINDISKRCKDCRKLLKDS